jgi:cell division protein FtsA
VGGRKPRQLSRQILSEIVQPRVEEIFTLVAKDIARAGFQDSATAGVVITGGTSIMAGAPEVAETVFEQPVRRGAPHDVHGLADAVASPIHATAVGLALHGLRRQATGPTAVEVSGRGRVGRVARQLATWFGEIF